VRRADARIAASFNYWFEIRTTRNSLHPEQKQPKQYLNSLNDSGDDERRFFITPDRVTVGQTRTRARDQSASGGFVTA